MKVLIRQSIKGTVVSYTGAVVGFFNTLWLFPLCFEPEQYGLTTVLVSAAFLLIPLTHLGTPTIIIRYFSYFSDERSRLNMFLNFITIYPLIGFLVFSAIWFIFKTNAIDEFKENSPLFANYFFLIIPLVFFILYFEIFSAYSTTLLKIVVPKFISEVLIRVFTGVLIILFFYQMLSFDWFIYLFVGTYGIALLLLLIYIGYLKKLHLKPNFGILKQDISLKPILIYGLYAVMGNAAGLIVTRIDTIMLGAMSGLGDAGIYTIAMYIGSIIAMPARSVTQIANPLVADAWKNGDTNKIHQLYQITSLNMFLAGGVLLVGIWTNMYDIFQLMPKGEIYAQGINVVLLIGLTKLIVMISSISDSIILNSKYYKFELVVVILLAFLTVTTNIIFIPEYGITGAAFATLLSLTLYSAAKMIFVRIKFKMHPFNMNIVKGLLILPVVYLCGYFIPTTGMYPVLDIAIRSSVEVIVLVFLILTLHVSKEADQIYHKIKSFTFRISGH